MFDFNELIISFQDYFVSSYDNSIFELALFSFGIILIFSISHITKYKKLKNARKKIPLVIGGWGTRGKSGTERIKAAMFNSLGYNIVSKTTGCEAMFLHSRGENKLKEMFLFRPYDKATIWEQYDLLKLSSKLETDIFLWECMALTPTYVEIIQQQWMKDDICTITNTYPDHENLQGPAGRDIPKVMTKFIPKDSILISSEEEMTPILQEDAKVKNTSFKSVGWKESGKIATDILERFPYDEHPYNIALVLELGLYLDIKEDVALKSMADLVVADIGVLKTFPQARYKNREIEFINGMSANERYGTISNWERVGLYNYTLENNPEIFISAIINNRADRVSRSRVFADIITFDLNCDLYFLIGTNQNGFIAYIRESFFTNRDKISLFTKNNQVNKLDEFAKRYRLPMSIDAVNKRIDVMQKSLEVNSTKSTDSIENFKKIVNEDFQFYTQIKKKIELNEDRVLIQKTFEEGLIKTILKRIVIIEDPHISGDQIINIVALNTPPGMVNKLIGLQNIKGTGLDFVYRFLSWEICYLLCNKILSKKRDDVRKGILELSKFKEFGPLSYGHVKDVLHKVKSSVFTQDELLQAEIDNILTSVITEEKIFNSVKKVKSKNKFIEIFFNFIESFLDAGDAIKRKKQVEQIYEDIIHYRISDQRAAIELKKINKRQKGGWLFKENYNEDSVKIRGT